MTPRQIALVQDSWKDVLAVPETAAQLFYLRLFALDPSLRPMFKGEIREQGRKLIAMMSVAVNGLARIEKAAGIVVEVSKGEVWLTQEHDPRDYFLRAGDWLRIDRPDTVVISATGDDAWLAVSPLRSRPGRVALSAVPA